MLSMGLNLAVPLIIIIAAFLIAYFRARSNLFALADATESKRTRTFWVLVTAITAAAIFLLNAVLRHRLVWPGR